MTEIKKTVLVVDDMRAVRVKLKKLCSDLGIKQVIEASDGVEALETIKTNKVDLILSDWNMPNLSGIDFVKQLRQMQDFMLTPVIFITSESDKTAILEAITLGIADYVVKPFPDAVVKTKICRALKIEPQA